MINVQAQAPARDPELLTVIAMVAAVAVLGVGWIRSSHLTGGLVLAVNGFMALATLAWAFLWVKFAFMAPEKLWKAWRTTAQQMVLFVQVLILLAGWFTQVSPAK